MRIILTRLYKLYDTFFEKKEFVFMKDGKNTYKSYINHNIIMSGEMMKVIK
jgi:hypothetical protein